MLTKSQVKYIQSLSQKKVRDEAGVFVAEGPKIINELLAGGEAEPRLEAIDNRLDVRTFGAPSGAEVIR